MLVGSESWTASAVHDLLHTEDAVEWREKVGVAGPKDGSAKPTTRLLSARGWVAKTRIDVTFGSAEAARRAAEEIREPGVGNDLWHPEKAWVVIAVAGRWLVVSLCPELETLRRLPTLDDRIVGWTEMVRLGLRHGRDGRGLDLNPANFGRDPRRDRIFYVDDEVYDRLDVTTLGGAIAARIPEEDAASNETWERWGRRLAQLVADDGELAVDDVGAAVGAYPLPERYLDARTHLVRALTQRRPVATRSRGARVAVLADVHANLAALDAVLGDARANGVDEFLFLGDAVGYGPEPTACVQRLAELPRAVCIRGNHDHAIATGRFELGMNGLARECAAWTRAHLDPASLSWLETRPIEHVEEGWLAVHGAPKDPRRFLAYVYELTYEDNLRYLHQHAIPLCFYGHTHVQLTHLDLPAGTQKLAGPRSFRVQARQHALVNPGSVGQPRDSDARAAYAIWDRTSGEITALRVAYDVDRTLAAIRAAELPSTLEHRLLSGA